MSSKIKSHLNKEKIKKYCDHPDVAVSYQNLTKEMVTKAYHIFLKVLGPDHPQTQGLKPFVDE